MKKTSQSLKEVLESKNIEIIVSESNFADYDADNFEILIGDTGYRETNQVFERLKIGDWEIDQVGNKLVIASYSREGLCVAINAFLKIIEEKKNYIDNLYVETGNIVDFIEELYTA